MHQFVSSDRLYGKGVFTTIAIHESAPFLWEKHWRRLTENADTLGIDVSEFSEEGVLDELKKRIETSNLERGRARITFADEGPSEIWSDRGEKTTSLSIITAGPRKVPDGFKLTISAHRINTTSPLVGIKSCNYLEHLMAHNEAKDRGFDEAIRLNDRGEVASACMANIFWIKDEKLYTPRLRTGCLPGTTREFILETVDCEEVEVDPESLDQADGMFLTSAGIGIAPVSKFNGKTLFTGHSKLFTEEIRSVFSVDSYS